MTISELTEVWNPFSFGIAAASGFLLGILVLGWIATNPLYATGEAGPAHVAWLTFGATAFAALVFYAGQTLATYLVNDPGWTRVMGRYGVWVLFAAAIGLGMWVRLRWSRDNRRHRAHDRAIDERRTR